MIEVWGPERIACLAALVDEAHGDEELSDDELLACCWDDPGVVLGTGVPGSGSGEEPAGAVAAAVRHHGDGSSTGFVKLLAVAPGSRRLGHGTALLARAEQWAVDQGADEMRLGGSAPFYLWPGVDVRWTPALCLAEAAGYAPVGAELNLSCPTSHRAPLPEGCAIRRLVERADVEAVTTWVAEDWPWWRAELERGIEQGGAFGAFVEDQAAGFACHSVNRAAWVGPMATRRSLHRAGTGSALLGELCRDLTVAGYSDAEIAWVGPVGFYAKAAGAAVSRVFRTYRRSLT